MFDQVSGQIIEAGMPVILQVAIAIFTLLGTIGIYYLTKFGNWWAKKTKAGIAEQAAIEALIAGVSHAHETIGLDLKKAAADGKLTKDERIKLRSAAIAHAQKVVKKEGSAYLAAATSERLDGAIKQILASWKK